MTSSVDLGFVKRQVFLDMGSITKKRNVFSQAEGSDVSDSD